MLTKRYHWPGDLGPVSRMFWERRPRRCGFRRVLRWITWSAASVQDLIDDKGLPMIRRLEDIEEAHREYL